MGSNLGTRKDDRSPTPVRASVGVGVACVILALAIYRPFQGRPIHILDFAEFIPLLDGSAGWASATWALTEYYASQGRVGVVAFALLAAKWSLFGWGITGWQLARAGLMLIIAGQMYVLLRRLGASRVGGVIGASVFLWAPAAADGWVRMTMGEPLGAAVVLAASLRAVHYQRTPHWRRDAVLVALAGAALILTKELLAPLLLLPVILALTVQPNGFLAAPKATQRNRFLLAVVCGVTSATMLPVAVFYLGADTAAYASLYGSNWQTPAAMLALWIFALIPFDPIPVPSHAVWAAAFLAFIGLVAVGWRAGFRHTSQRGSAVWLLLIAVTLPLVGVLVYFPNPWFARFYYLPYLIGAAILLGMAATYVEMSGSAGRVWAVLSGALIFVCAISSAAELASRTDAVQRRDDALISAVASMKGVDSVLFATSRPPPEEWKADSSAASDAPRGLGATLHRFAAATGRPWPRTRDIACEKVNQTQGSVVIINLESSCAFASVRQPTIVYRYHRIDWRRWQVVVDSAYAHVMPAMGARPEH